MAKRPRRSLDDRIHPLVVRDVRRSLRERTFPAVFALVPAGCLLLCWLVVDERRPIDSGQQIAMTLWIASVLTAWLLFPISCYRWAWEERKAGTLEPILVTALSQQGLLRGRILSNLVQLLLLLSTTLPFVAFCYLLGGIGIDAVAFAAAALVGGSIILHYLAASLGFAPRSTGGHLGFGCLFVGLLFFIGCMGLSFTTPWLATGKPGPLRVGTVGALIFDALLLTSLVVGSFVRDRQTGPLLEPLLEVEGLSQAFESKWAVYGLSFSIDPGEIVGLIGSNGAGKTTTLRLLATHLKPFQGWIRYQGHLFRTQPRSVRATFGHMPDKVVFSPATTVHEDVDFFARAYGVTEPARSRTVAEILEFAGLAPMADRLATDLSKGMRQRLAFARALVHDPPLLFLDEPMEGLDPRARFEFRQLLRALSDQGKAILISSHILTELADLVDRVLIVEQGQIVAAGTVDSLARGLEMRPVVSLKARQDQDVARIERALHERPDIERIQVAGDWVHVEGPDGDRLVHDLFAAGVRLEAMQAREADLEQVFLQLTRGQLA